MFAQNCDTVHSTTFHKQCWTVGRQRSLCDSHLVAHLGHGVLVEGEGDVGTVALGMTLGAQRAPVRRPALALTGARLDEAALVSYGHAGLSHRALGPTLGVDAAGSGPAVHLVETRGGGGGGRGR